VYYSENVSIEQNRTEQNTTQHNTTELQLAGTYNDHLAQLPDKFSADEKLKHVIKGIFQIPLKH